MEILRKRSGCLVRVRQWVANLPFPSIQLANDRRLENKWDERKAHMSYQQDIKNYNILCFTESWLNDDIKNIQLAGYTHYRQDRTAASGKTRGGGLCIFVNNSWCTISKDVSRFCSSKVEYLMISCRPHYLPRVFICIFRSCLYTTTDRGWHENRTQWALFRHKQTGKCSSRGGAPSGRGL
jgi:hypothetical protein